MKEETHGLKFSGLLKHIDIIPENNMSPCSKCNYTTKSIKKGRTYLVCDKCGSDKTLSDVFFYEAKDLAKKKENELLEKLKQETEMMKK